MTSPYDTYTSPLASRNASPAMLKLWSARHKFNTWRRIWLAVAEAQHEVTKDWGKGEGEGGGGGPLPDGRGSSGPLVTKAQVEALRAVVERGITDAEMARATELERELRHDVMAHVHCLGESCPEAKGIIHLGCTSQDVVCNADIIIMRSAVELVEYKLVRAIVDLGLQGKKSASVPTVGWTHYQTAQPVTVGRRLCGWASDLRLCLNRIGWNESGTLRDYLNLKGFRGATGTQASFLSLFDGDGDMVDEFEIRTAIRVGCRNVLEEIGSIDRDDIENTRAANVAHHRSEAERYAAVGDQEHASIARECAEELAQKTLDQLVHEHIEMGLGYVQGLVGQTYPRVVDAFLLADLAGIAAVLHKIATDIRLLSNRKELDEPFGDKQIGSSAMPYKRNPMKCGRICGLTRFVMNLVGNAYDTAATQWLERTLDDSSNRRLSLPEAFLALDGALDLMHEVASGLVVHEAMVRKNLMAELPFLATENILMAAVRAGGDRQELHEKIRVHAQAAGMRVKQEGLENDLIERLRADPAFASVHHLLTEDALLDPMQYVGRSVEQTARFVDEVVEPLRVRYEEELRELGSSDRGV